MNNLGFAVGNSYINSILKALVLAFLNTYPLPIFLLLFYLTNIKENFSQFVNALHSRNLAAY